MNEDDSLVRIEALFLKLEGAYAENTLRAYRADILEFCKYCQSVGVSTLPALPDTIADFVYQVISGGIKSATIRRKVSSISAVHRLSNLKDPTKDAEVTLAVRKMHRQLGRHAVQARAVNLPELEQFLNATGDDIRGCRDRALLLLGYDTLRRRAELVTLQIEDLEIRSDGTGVIFLRKNKTDQDRIGKYLHLSGRTCSALREWFLQARISDGYVLRGVNLGNKISKSLGEGQISRIYKKIARSAGLDEKLILEISGHSLRVGAAQDLLKSGATLPQIMVKGGWTKPDTVVRYTEKTLIESRQLL